MNMIKAEQYGQTDDMKNYYWKSAKDQIKELMIRVICGIIE